MESGNYKTARVNTSHLQRKRGLVSILSVFFNNYEGLSEIDGGY
jgi:hypothetical protein